MPERKAKNAIDTSYGHIQPQATDIERVVLGALMIDKDAFSIVSEILKPETFYEPRNQKIYRAIQTLSMNENPVDIMTVIEELRHEGALDEVGGPTYIVDLSSHVASSANIEYHARILAHKFMARQLISFAGVIETKAFDETTDVDELMQDYRLSVDETKSINNAIEEKVQRVDKLVEKVAKLVSQATDLPAISAASRCDSATVSRFDLIQAGQGSFILVVMLSDDQVFNKLIKLPVSVDETDLKLLAALLNTAMTELPPEGFTPALLDKVMRSAGRASSLVPVIVDFTTDVLRHRGSTNVAVAGQARLLGFPEYRDVDKAQKVLESIDEDTLGNLPAIMQSENGTKVLVGPENVAQELKDTSVVMTKFDIGDGMQGMIGVVGPTRMDYAKVTARLSYFAESLSKAFAKPETKQLPQPNEEASESKEV